MHGLKDFQHLGARVSGHFYVQNHNEDQERVCCCLYSGFYPGV